MRSGIAPEAFRKAFNKFAGTISFTIAKCCGHFGLHFASHFAGAKCKLGNYVYMAKFPLAERNILGVSICKKCKTRNSKGVEQCRKCFYPNLRPKRARKKEAKGK